MSLTLADAITDNKTLLGQCVACGKEKKVDPTTLSLDPDILITDIGYKMRCTQCKEKRVMVTVDRAYG